MLPRLDELLILKYTDRGEKKKLRIINAVSHKWKDITILICDEPYKIVGSKLEEKYPGNPSECLKHIFIDYFINKKPQRYSQDWNGLLDVLKDAKLEKLANLAERILSLESGGQLHESQHHEVNICLHVIIIVYCFNPWLVKSNIIIK